MSTIIPAPNNPQPVSADRPEWDKLSAMAENCSRGFLYTDFAIRCRQPGQLVAHTARLRADLLAMLAIAERLADL